jgi:Ca2+-binding RTX toxin-like protein
MAIFSIDDSYGAGFNMSASTASGVAPITAASGLVVDSLLYDNGATAFLAVSGAGPVDMIGIDYNISGNELLIKDLFYYDENDVALLSIVNLNLDLNINTLKSGSYVAFQVTTLSDRFIGTHWKDVIHAGPGNDVVHGNGAGDMLSGDAGNDWVYGDAGNDTLLGAAGADRLYGGAGADQMTGGAGDDHFVYVSATDSKAGAPNHDTIYDFDDQGNDTIDLSALYSGTLKWMGTHAFTGAHQVNIKDIPGPDLLVQVNLDTHTNTSEVEILLKNTTVASMTSSDFFL